MFKKLIIVSLFFAVKTLMSQNPVLKVYIDAKELNKNDGPVYAFVKAGSKYYSILDTGGKTIVLPNHVDIRKIQSFRFIVKTDTIVFSVNKILEDLKKSPEKDMSDELTNIFSVLTKWELHIDYFQYVSEKTLLNPKENAKPRTSIYTDYKIYALRTNGMKYYIVKA